MRTCAKCWLGCKRATCPRWDVLVLAFAVLIEEFAMKVKLPVSLLIVGLFCSVAFAVMPVWNTVNAVQRWYMGQEEVQFYAQCANVPAGNHRINLYVEADGSGENAQLCAFNPGVAVVDGVLTWDIIRFPGTHIPVADYGWTFYFVIEAPGGNIVSGTGWVSHQPQ